MLDRLKLKERDSQPTSTTIPNKLGIVDLYVFLKAWMYFLHHTLDTNQSGSELINVKALALYCVLTRRAVNVRRIISADMDEMA